MFSVHLPTLNACLNTAVAVFLSAGYFFIKRKKISAHKICMTLAFLTSVLFLGSYLYYHFNVGATPFQREGWIRPVYFTLLISHTLLATAIIPLVLITLYHAWRKNFKKHAKIAKWTWPLWMYVSVTGVLVYLFLYHLGPST